MPKHSSHIIDLARRGAEARLHELATEARRLFAAFPDLHKSFDRDELPVSFLIAEGARRGQKVAEGKRRKMSARARRAASARMKAYWAKRKAQA
jgi:hypothetical protein